MAKRNKRTQNEIDRIIERCKFYIVRGYRDVDILNTLAKPDPNHQEVNIRQGREFLHRAHEEFGKEALPNIAAEREKALIRYNMLFSKCFEKGQYKNAAIIQSKIDVLLGTAEATKLLIELSGKNGGAIRTQSAFQATIIDAKGIAAAMEKELEEDRQRRLKNGG